MLMLHWEHKFKPTKGWAVMYKGEIVYLYDQGKRIFSRKHLADAALAAIKDYGRRYIDDIETLAMIKDCTVEEVK